MRKVIRTVFSLAMGMMIFCSSFSLASAADYWIWGDGGYNYYIVTEKSSLIDEWSAKASMKEVSPNGSVYTYNLYMWEMKGELFYSRSRADVGTRRGRITRDYNGLVGKAYDYMMKHF